MATARQDPRIDIAQTVSHFLWADDIAEPEFTIGGHHDDGHGVWRIDLWRGDVLIIAGEFDSVDAHVDFFAEFAELTRDI